LLALLEDSNNRIHAFGKSWKKNLRSMPSHNPLLSDRTEDKDVDMAMAVAVVVEDSLWKNANAISTITSVSIVAYLDISLSTIPHCQIHDLVPVLDHKAADCPSDKSIPFQKKGWRNCHSKTKVKLILLLSRMESATSRIQRIPSPSSPKAAPKLKYSHMVESTLRPRDPGKLSPDLSRVRSRDISTTWGSRDIQTRDPGKVSHDLPRDWSSTRSQVTTRSPDRARFRRMPSLLIGMWKTVETINESTNQRTSHKTWECSKGAHPLPVFVPALKYGPPV